MRYIFFCLLLITCVQIQNIKAEPLSAFQVTSKDTVITYDIEGISTEGARAKVKYVHGEISGSTTDVYGEMGKASIVYKFEKDRIKVSEIQYRYIIHFANVKSENDIRISKKLTYYIDYNGNLIGTPVPDRVDIFEEFKKTVAFELN